MVLQTLAMGTIHGYGIAAIIREQSQGLLDPGAGVLYPALRRLERMGWIRSEWSRTDTGRKARFYVLSEKGEKALKKETARWEGHVEAVSAVLRHARG
jgi:transcriptional regulator